MYGSFAWVSMMDVLFALFGGLVVLTVILSTKLGATTAIDERPFHALTIQVTSLFSNVDIALQRMHVGMVVFRNQRYACEFGASYPHASCLNEIGEGEGSGNRLAEFATSAERGSGPQRARLTATLLITQPKDRDALVDLHITPVLRKVAEFRSHPDIGPDQAVVVRLSVKSQRSVWDVPPFEVTVEELLRRATETDQTYRFGAPLISPNLEGQVKPGDKASAFGKYGRIEVRMGGRIDLSWQ